MSKTVTKIVVCPGCEQPLNGFYVNAPATFIVSRVAGAEVRREDVQPENIKTEDHYNGTLRHLVSFRLDDKLEMLEDDLDHYALEIDSEDAEFYCLNCNHELSLEVFDAWRETDGH